MEDMTTLSQTRSTRKEARLRARGEVKAIRQNKDLNPFEKRQQIQRNKVYNKVGRDGAIGGDDAVTAFNEKNAAKWEKQASRAKTVQEKRTARIAKRDAKKGNRNDMNVKRRETSAYKQNDTDFFKRNAKQRGMTLPDYYAKYVRNR